MRGGGVGVGGGRVRGRGGGGDRGGRSVPRRLAALVAGPSACCPCIRRSEAWLAIKDGKGSESDWRLGLATRRLGRATLATRTGQVTRTGDSGDRPGDSDGRL